MPSVRDKYRSAVQELQRAESVPERFHIFRRVWAWVVEASRTSAAFAGILIIPIILITVGSVWYNDCGEKVETTTPMIAIGVLLLICALYLPIYNRAKVKARKAREDARIGNEPVINTSLTEEEIRRYVPFHMDKVCKFAYMACLGILPYTTWKLFFPTDGNVECHPIVYWTAFVVCITFVLWIVAVLLSCFLACCVFVVFPSCKQCTKRGRAAEEV